MLEDTSVVDFHLLNKVLNVSLHGMLVRLDGVERDVVFATPWYFPITWASGGP